MSGSQTFPDHHIVTDLELRSQILTELGLDLNDWGPGLITLPFDRQAAESVNIPWHSGNHQASQYAHFVTIEVERILDGSGTPAQQRRVH